MAKVITETIFPKLTSRDFSVPKMNRNFWLKVLKTIKETLLQFNSSASTQFSASTQHKTLTLRTTTWLCVEVQTRDGVGWSGGGSERGAECCAVYTLGRRQRLWRQHSGRVSERARGKGTGRGRQAGTSAFCSSQSTFVEKRLTQLDRWCIVRVG